MDQPMPNPPRQRSTNLSAAVAARLDEMRVEGEARNATSTAGQAAAARNAELDRQLALADKHPLWFAEQPAALRQTLAAHAERRARADAAGGDAA